MIPEEGASPGPSNPAEASHAKRVLRSEILRRLAALAPGQVRTLSESLCDALFQHAWSADARSVLVYLATPREPDLSTAIDRWLTTGASVSAPRTDWQTCTLQAHRLADPRTDLIPGRYGLREPAPHCPPVPAEHLDLVLVPGVAFDLRGMRLGRGGGFYDRFLSRRDLRALRVGVAFDVQIVPCVPQQPHDTGVDLVVTPSRVVDARRGT